MGALRGWHIIVLVAVLVLLFGYNRLPNLARSLGRSLRIIKAETRGLAEDDVAAKAAAEHRTKAKDKDAVTGEIADNQPSPPPSASPLSGETDPAKNQG